MIKETLALQSVFHLPVIQCYAPYSSCNLPPGDLGGVGGGGDQAGIIEKGMEQRKGFLSICSPRVSSGRRERPNGQKITQ